MTNPLRLFREAAVLALSCLIVSSLGAQPAEKPARSKAEAEAEQDAARAAKWLQQAFKGQTTPEAAEMLIAIAKGSQMGPGDGWFHAGQSRYGWKWLAEKHGIKPGEPIPREKFLGSEALFNRLDRNKDGQLRSDDFDWTDRTSFAMQSSMVGYVFRRMNNASDGRLTREEWIKFFDEAARGRDHLTTDSLRDALMAGPPPKSGPAPEGPTPELLVRGLFRGEIGSMSEGPKLNDAAPDFTLKSRDGKETVRLSDRIGKKPIVLVFGNVTCGPFRAIYPRVDDLAVQYKDQVDFLAVYVREAHPTDGWRMESNDDAGVTFAQPKDYAERCTLANGCNVKLKMNMPLLVDEMDDRVGHAYSGMPARLYLIDRAGKIAYKSGRGPFGFKPDELEQSIVMMLMEEQPNPAETGVRVLDDKEAWKRLPEADRGAGQPLPVWARALAEALPRTTAAMLELDYIQRAKSPLDPKLRAAMRWVAAHANWCVYSEAYAEADLRRAGASDDEMKALKGDHANLPESERLALAFARKLTLAAHTVTDAEMARLNELHGEKNVTAMVLLLAYANFQDRLLLTLDLDVESGGPRQPLDVHFVSSPVQAQARSLAPVDPNEKIELRVEDPEWRNKDFLTLQKEMESQRGREPRITVPAWDDVKKNIPAGVPVPAKPVRIRWSLVCMGYQPELAMAWGNCTRAFGQEAKQDRVFEETLFWVVTRSLNCFY